MAKLKAKKGKTAKASKGRFNGGKGSKVPGKGGGTIGVGGGG
jgi:hypothetical protein